MTFIDTNVWVYALSAQDHTKKKQAEHVIIDAFLHDTICVSTQVLKEFANFSFKKTRKSAEEINVAIEKIASYVLVADTKDLVVAGVSAKESHKVGFYDALMIVAANNAGCSRLYSEDLNDGQVYGSVRVINPFISAQ